MNTKVPVADTITAEESRKMFDSFTELTKTMTERRARRKICQSFHHDSRTVYALIEDEKLFYITKARNELLRDAKEKGYIDWDCMVPQALSLFYDGLYFGRDLNTTELQLSKYVLGKVDKNGDKPKDDEQKVF